MKPALCPVAAPALLAFALLCSAPRAAAQDSFRDPLLRPGRAARTAEPQQPASPPPLQQRQRFEPPAPPPTQQAPADATARGFTGAPGPAVPNADDDPAETHDFGIEPTAQLRPTAQLHWPTPTTIPGGQVVRTRQLAQWLQDPRDQPVLLLHAIASNRHLPNATPAVPASQGGSFDDEVQRGFGQYLGQATGGDRSRRIVTYCAGVQCWGSYNAALRAIQLGYRNVYWYRGGLDAWARAGLPVPGAGEPSTAPVPPAR